MPVAKIYVTEGQYEEPRLRKLIGSRTARAARDSECPGR